MICEVSLCLALGLMYGCAQTGQYTSKDLTILPCEQKANEFFFPLEFDEAGNYVYEDEAPAIENALNHTQSIYVFVHGWNKTTKLAETDYQDLICRFYTHSKHDSVNAKKSMIIGVFWPSADFPPLLNFWSMKSRADDLALTGFQNLMKLLAKPAIESGAHQDLVLIGHSFGGRIIIQGIGHYIAQLNPDTLHFLSSLNKLQLILLTTAMGEFFLIPHWGVNEDILAFNREWDSKAFHQEMVKQYGREFTHNELLIDIRQLRLQWHPTLIELSGLTDFRIYNIFSTHDDANRFMYPIGSLMERGGPMCAIGACGVSQWPNLASTTSAGSLEPAADLLKHSNLWNIDASRVILSHTDIYKGRIANLVWSLIALPRPQSAEASVGGSIIRGDPTVYELMAQENKAAMKTINQYRQMGEAGLKSIKELSALAFEIDKELKEENWPAAEKGIRELAALKDFYPGWYVEFGMGLIEKGLLYDSSSTRVEWYPLTRWTVHTLLAHVLARQGKCEEARREEGIGGPLFDIWAWDEKWAVSRSFQSYTKRLPYCHEEPPQVQ